MDATCNGWKNYETWKVKLELIDDDFVQEIISDGGFNVESLAEYLEDYCVEIVQSQTTEGFAYDCAMATLHKVDWEEIAAHAFD